jgi:hypothetical protein
MGFAKYFEDIEDRYGENTSERYKEYLEEVTRVPQPPNQIRSGEIWATLNGRRFEDYMAFPCGTWIRFCVHTAPNCEHTKVELEADGRAHVLAHGYTHLGRDIDGDFWANEGFGGSGADVVEGLAQFYTDIITKKLVFRAPGAHEAYARFLTLQSGPYVAHTKWLEDSPEKRSETVRFTMLAGRQEGAITHDRWKALLGETASRLKRGKSPPK